MLRRPMVGRGRPGLLGTMARTAVVAGTASATVNAVNNRGARKQEAAMQDQAAQQQMMDQQQQIEALQQQQAQTPAGPATAPGGGPDLATKLKSLADLHAAGALTDDEFGAAKSKLLGV